MSALAATGDGGLARTPPRAFCGVYCGSRAGQNPNFMAAGAELGKLLQENNVGLVYGGGNTGIMGAIADAVISPSGGTDHPGGYVVGVFPQNVSLIPNERLHSELSETIFTPSLEERKKVMFARADFSVALPGGTGTLDELVELLSKKNLQHEGHDNKPILILNVDGYYEHFHKFLISMLDAGFLGREYVSDLVEFCDTPLDILNCMKLKRPDLFGA